ncbi:DUF4292 domain-containing protein [Flavobacteriaceae bacterium R38]|nr:DUF4292 domain-containing protein [Flavobacteriaceae bacterium R38]
MNLKVEHKYSQRTITVLSLIVLFILQSCKTSKSITESTAAKKISARTIVKNHNDNKLQFKTIRGRIRVGYESDGDSQSHSITLRMEKDKAIMLSAAFGVVKAYITPDRVSFYNKLHNEYFDGDFSYLSDLLGTELDFEKVQNMLLGQAIFSLEDDKYRTSIVNNNYQLKPAKDFELFKRLFLIEPSNFKMTLQQISQPKEGRTLNINYKAYQKVDDKIFPENIEIIAEEIDNKVKIEIDYKNVEFDQRVSFPYKIPKGYKEIVLK